jgi:transcriptional regulator with XRE-family HTH domain
MAELDRAAISLRIAEAREQAGLTQPELADLLEVHWRTVQEWESPRKDVVPWKRLDEIARAAGVTRDWLLHGDAPRESPDRVLEELSVVKEEVAALRGEVAGLAREVRAIGVPREESEPAREEQPRPA